MTKSPLHVGLTLVAAVALSTWIAAISVPPPPPPKATPEQLVAAGLPATLADVRQFTKESARAEIEIRGHDFGDVAPFRKYEYVFKLRNVGVEPLILTRTGAQTENVDIDLGDGQVPAGETKAIIASWNAMPSDELFSGKSLITTNDPTNPVIKLELLGRTKLLLAADPPSLTLPRIPPHEAARVETKIVSEHWKSFEIEEVRSSLPGATWQLERLAPDKLGAKSAVSGWRLAVTLPPGLPEGTLTETVTVIARPSAESQNSDSSLSTEESTSVERNISLIGNVARRLTVYGKDIDIWGTISAGTIDLERGYGGTFTVRVNDAEPQLRLVDTYATPSFVEARWEPYQQNVADGLYRLIVRIPPQKVPAVYQGQKKAKLTLVFDHPRISQLDLGLEFIVLKSRSTSLTQNSPTTALPNNN